MICCRHNKVASLNSKMIRHPIETTPPKSGELRNCLLTLQPVHQFSFRAFVCSAQAILIIAALLKLASVFTRRSYLDAPAPLFTSLSWREMLLIATLLEATTVVFVFCNRNGRFALLSILWLSTTFAVFRGALWLIGYHGPCNCLGYLGEWLSISKSVLDGISVATLFYLLCGSAFFLLL